jgi:hypothetical protein
MKSRSTPHRARHGLRITGVLSVDISAIRSSSQLLHEIRVKQDIIP